MTRRDFEVVARGIAMIEDINARCAAATTLAAYFAVVWPRFRKDLFMRACGT